MDRKEKVTLYTLYDGELESILPLPGVVKKTIDKLDGKTMTLEEAVNAFLPATKELNGKIDVYDRLKYICFTIDNDSRKVKWVLLRYE